MGNEKKLTGDMLEDFLTVILPKLTDEDVAMWEPTMGGMFNGYGCTLEKNGKWLDLYFEYLQDDKPTVQINDDTFKGYQYRSILEAIDRQNKRFSRLRYSQKNKQSEKDLQEKLALEEKEKKKEPKKELQIF